jgi:hypothetical protein
VLSRFVRIPGEEPPPAPEQANAQPVAP